MESSVSLSNQITAGTAVTSTAIESTWAGMAAGELKSSNTGEEIVAAGSSGNIYLLGQSGSSISALTTFTSSTTWAGVACGDISSANSGKEVIGISTGGSAYLFGQNLASLSLSGTVPSTVSGVATGDFDLSHSGDEIATIGTNNKIQIWKIDGSNSLAFITEFVASNSPQWNGIAAGDFDGDGTSEVMVHRNSDGEFVIYKIKSGTLQEVGDEHFPLNQQNGVMTSVRLSDYPHSDALVTFRNYDGQINIFNMDGQCQGLNLADLTINEAFTIDDPSTSSVPDNNYIVDYHVNNILTASTVTITDASNVTFIAGNEIDLLPGFTVDQGSEFSGTIDETNWGCGTHSTFRKKPPVLIPPNNTAAKSRIDFSVIPNPSNGKFTLKVRGSKDAYSIVITNMLGKVILEKKNLNTSQQDFDLNDVPKGVYLVRVSQQDMSKVRKVVVM